LPSVIRRFRPPTLTQATTDGPSSADNNYAHTREIAKHDQKTTKARNNGFSINHIKPKTTTLILTAIASLTIANVSKANIENGSFIPGTGALVFTSPEDPVQEDRAPTSYDVTATYNIPDPSAKLFVSRTWQPINPDGSLGPVRTLTLDVGNFMNGPGTYTIHVLQNSAYGVETLQAVTFRVTGYSFNGTAGITTR